MSKIRIIGYHHTGLPIYANLERYEMLDKLPFAEQIRFDDALLAVREEVRRAARKFKPFASAHEGYAIIKEEVDELWEAVKMNHLKGARAEALQVAAMAIRFIADIDAQGKSDNTRDGDPK